MCIGHLHRHITCMQNEFFRKKISATRFKSFKKKFDSLHSEECRLAQLDIYKQEYGFSEFEALFKLEEENGESI